MRISRLFGIAVVAAGLSVSACSSPAPAAVVVTGETPFAGGTQGQGGASSSTGTTGSSGPGAGSSTDVPCDVATYLAAKCTSCHGDPPLPSALAGLVTLADLKKVSTEDPTMNEAQLSVVRMKDATKPMPPGALPTAADVAILENWINAGYPMGSCGEAGVPMARPVVSVFKNAPAFVAHTGQVISTNEVKEHDGYAQKDCMSSGCHGRNGDGPALNFGGTLYDGSGNPLGGAEVRLVDAKGNVFTAYSASNGTFYSRSQRTDAGQSLTVTAPSQVGVRNASSATDMLTALAATGGACNSCHCTDTSDGGKSSCTVPLIHLP